MQNVKVMASDFVFQSKRNSKGVSEVDRFDADQGNRLPLPGLWIAPHCYSEAAVQINKLVSSNEINCKG